MERGAARVRIGSALFNADHARLGEELERTERAGVDFFHLDVFDGIAVRDQGFPPRTVKRLRERTKLPFEVHLSAVDPVRFLDPLAEAGCDLVFLPAEYTPLLYETVYTVREKGMKAGVCLALGTPLAVLESALPIIDAVLLLGRVTGEGSRGRDFNRLVIERLAKARWWIDEMGLDVDLQAAGGLETASCVEACRAGATSLPLGGALHRESDMAAFVSFLRTEIEGAAASSLRDAALSEGAKAPLAPLPPSSDRFLVFVASRSFGKACPEVIDKMRAAGCDLASCEFERAPTEEELIERIADTDLLVSGTEPVTARVMDAAPRLKGISKHGVGVENIDLAAARERGIKVCIAGGAIADSVADMTLALLLGIARGLPKGDRSVRDGLWKRFTGPELAGKILGVVGLGQIGKGVCRRAKGFGMRLIAYDPFPDVAFAGSWGVEVTTLDEVLERSDFVSLHVPVTPETRRLIDAERLRRMKPTAYLINTARGELVDETALHEALRDGVIAGAAADVFAKEPPGDHPLLHLDNFIAMPHCGGQTYEGLRRMGEITADNALRILRGEEPFHRIA